MKWRKTRCEFCGEVEKTVEVRGKHFYLTSQCTCPAAIQPVAERAAALDRSHEQWLAEQPKSEKQLLIEAMDRLSEAIRERVEHEK